MHRDISFQRINQDTPHTYTRQIGVNYTFKVSDNDTWCTAVTESQEIYHRLRLYDP
jgi:hypothetical protein